MSTTGSVNNPLGRLAAQHPALVRVARVGWLAKGAVYVIAGGLALLIAAKASGWSKSATAGTQEASPTGALKTIAEGTGGRLLLALLGIGLSMYAAWRVASAFLPGGTDAKAWAKRIGYVVSAVLYVSFAVTAFSFARGTSPTATNGNSTVAKTSGGIMQHSGGRLVIGVVGVIVILVGLYRMAKGVKLDVTDELDLGRLPSQRRRLITRVGAAGEIGRGLGISLIGYFLLRAAITYDAAQATGLDGALRTLVAKTFGLLVVVVVGTGFVAYGSFCAATFTHRRLEAP